MSGLTTGKLARLSKVNIETIRYYERRYLLPKPERSSAGYREFPQETVEVVHFIKKAQGLGFSLKEIKELLGLSADKGATCGDVKDTAERKLAEIDVMIRQLKLMQRVLNRLVRACPGEGTLSKCSIIESLKEG